MIPTPIPANIDVIQLIADLNATGWRDYKIEAACGFSRGYIGQLKCGNVVTPNYQYAARLHNLWCDYVSRGTLDSQTT